MKPTPNNTPFFIGMLIAALISTAIFNYFTYKDVEANRATFRRIEHRIDSLNKANGRINYQKDSIRFNKSNHFDEHSKI